MNHDIKDEPRELNPAFKTGFSQKTWPQPLRGSFFRWACDPVVWQDVIGGPTRSLVRWCQAECEMLARWRDAFRTDLTVLQGNIFGGPLHALYNIHLRHLRWNFTTSSSCWVRWDAPAHGTKSQSNHLLSDQTDTHVGFSIAEWSRVGSVNWYGLVDTR